MSFTGAGARVWGLAPALALSAALSAGQAFAQPAPAGPTNALQGFSQNRGQPINIESNSLELRDKEKIATFSDNVRVTQGDTTIECKVLVVYYADETPPAAGKKSAKPSTPMMGPSGQQQIRRLEAKGGVIVTQKDQTATGDSAVFEMKTNTVTLLGNVVVMQGQNVLRGDKLWVDLNTNVSRVESGKSGQSRVQGLFQPSTARDPRQQGESSGGSPAPAAATPQTTGSAPANGARGQATSAEKDKDKDKNKQAPRPLKLN
jgi:lipopolysaccharide export system protein LptA